MKVIKIITIMAFIATALFLSQATEAAELKVYGKGGVSGEHGTGGTSVKICPETSTDVCVTLTIDIDEIKIDGIDGNVIIIKKDDVSVLRIPEIDPVTGIIQGESIEIKLIE